MSGGGGEEEVGGPPRKAGGTVALDALLNQHQHQISVNIRT